MLFIAVQVFLSYSSRNLIVTPCNGLIGHGCLNQLFMMLICLWVERCNTFRTLLFDKAQSAIEGYGYSGDSYYEALKELEARFGKPSLVVKVTLDRLRKTSRIQNDRPHEVRNLSDVVSTTVWIFKRFRYINDLAAEANISISVIATIPRSPSEVEGPCENKQFNHQTWRTFVSG